MGPHKKKNSGKDHIQTGVPATPDHGEKIKEGFPVRNDHTSSTENTARLERGLNEDITPNDPEPVD